MVLSQLTHRMPLIPVQPPLADMESLWSTLPETDVGLLKVRAANSVQDLHLRFSTDDPGLQQQLSGQCGQSLLLWFTGPRDSHGVRIDFKPKASFSLGAEPLDTVDQVVTLLGPSAEGLPRRWIQDTEGIELSSEMLSGELVYEVRLPLCKGDPGAFGLDIHPGEVAVISIASAYLDPGLIVNSQEQDPGAVQDYAGGDPYGAPLQQWNLQDYNPGDGLAANGTFSARIRYRLSRPRI